MASQLSMDQRTKEVLDALVALLSVSADGFDDRVLLFLRKCKEVMGLDGAMLSCLQEDQYTCLFLDAKAGLDVTPNETFNLADTLCERLGAVEKGVFCEDVGQLERPSPLAERLQMLSYCGAPVRVDGALFGTLVFFGDKPRQAPFDDESRAFLQVFAATLGAELSRRTAQRALRAASTTLRRLSRVDPVTQLLNRRGIEEKVVRLAARHAKGGGLSSVVRVELQDFRGINERFGPSMGDIVLGEIATALTSVLRPTDMLARVGGASFLAVLPDASREDVDVVARRMLFAVREHRTVHSAGTVRVNATMSVAPLNSDAQTLKHIFEQFEVIYQAEGPAEMSGPEGPLTN